MESRHLPLAGMEFEESFFKAGCHNKEVFRLRPPSLSLWWPALKVADKRRCRPAYRQQVPGVGLRLQVPKGTIDCSAMLQRGAKGRVLIFISPRRDGTHQRCCTIIPIIVFTPFSKTSQIREFK